MSGSGSLLLDAAPLGVGYRSQRTRAGIYRVVKRTVAGLIDAGVGHGVTATASPWIDLLTQAEHAELFPALAPRWVPAHARPFGGAERWHGLLGRARTGGRWEINRIAAALASRALCARMRPVHLGDWEVVHSLFDPLPDAQRLRSRAQLLTVYDLTSLTHPGCHTQDTRKQVGAAIQSLLASSRTWALCLSEYTRSELLRLTDFSSDRALVLPLGVEDRFRPASPEERQRVRCRYGIGERPFLLSLGSNEPRKNLPRTVAACLRAFSRCNNRDSYLVVAGPSGWGVGLDPSAVGDRVRMIGFVEDCDLPALYSAATGFVYCSLAEGFGLPVLEAMACGLPVVCSGTTSLPEVAGDAAVLVDPGDEDAMVDGIAALLNRTDLRKDLAAAGLRRAATMGWDRYIDDYRAILAKVGRVM